MSRLSLGTLWCRGWRMLFAIMLFNLGMGAVSYGARLVLPDDEWVRWWATVVLGVSVGPIAAWLAYRAVFSASEPRTSVPSIVVATFSDEASAHIAASALGQCGIHAVITTAAVGQQSGIPIPVGGLQLVVSSKDQARAEAALAKAREHGGRP